MIDPLALRLAELYSACKEGREPTSEEVLDVLDDLTRRLILLEARLRPPEPPQNEAELPF